MPYYYRRKYQKKRPSYRKKKSTTKKAPKVSKTFSAKVNKVVNRKLETKTWVANSGPAIYLAVISSTAGWDGTVGPNYSVSGTAYTPVYIDHTPLIPHGTTQSARIGQNVEIVNAYAKILIHQSSFSNASYNCYCVDFYCGYWKPDPNSCPSLASATPFRDFMYTPNAQTSEAKLSNSMLYHNGVVDEDAWKIYYHRRCYIGTPQVSAGQLAANADYKSHCEFTIPLKNVVPKKVAWIESATVPSNTHGPYYFFYLRQMNDGSQMPTNNNQPWCNVETVFKYKDA